MIKILVAGQLTKTWLNTHVIFLKALIYGNEFSHQGQQSFLQAFREESDEF